MPTWLGIDIGKSAVKVAVVKTAYRRLSLQALASSDVVGADVTGAIQTAVLAALGQPGTGDGMAVAIEGARVAVRSLSLPASAQRQLAEVLPFELEAQVPFDLGESVFDYRVLAGLRALPGADPEALPVIAAVAKVAEVRARIDQVKGALAVEPERVGVGAFPLANSIPWTPGLGEAGTVAIVDLGQKTSDVLVVRAGEPVFTRTLSYGTEGLPQTANRLAREIRVTLGAYRSAGGDEPSQIYLCGGGAFVSGAESFLAGELNVPVSVLPAPTLEFEGPAKERALELPRYAKAVGLALGLTRPLGLDLRKGPLAYERGYAWIKEKIPMLAGLGAVIAVSFLFQACAQLYATGKDKTALEGALGIVSKEVFGEETLDPDRANDLLAKDTAGADEDPMPHADAFDVMVKLSEDIPQSMTHDIEELDIQKAHVVVHGIVGSIPDAQAILTSLQNERCFSDVKITRTTQVVGGERQKYVMEFDMKCPEDVKGDPKKKAAKPASSSSAPADSASGGK